jgi:hypothetical protein
MSPASKLVALIPRTEAPESKDREVPPFAASLLSRGIPARRVIIPRNFVGD